MLSSGVDAHPNRAHEGAPSCVLQQGVSINERAGELGQTPLHVAAEKGRMDIVHLLHGEPLLVRASRRSGGGNALEATLTAHP